MTPRPFSSASRGVSAAVLIVVALGCHKPPDSRVEAWLFCDDCERNQRDSAAALGDRAVPMLADILRAFPRDWRSNTVQRYGTAARRIGLTGQDSTAYVERFMANIIASVSSRAAFTLGDIGTPKAIAALQAALADSAARNYRSDVIRDLHRSMIGATTERVDGAYPTGGRQFLDTVWITRSGAIPWDADEFVTLQGAPFPSDVSVGFRAGNTELGFVPAALPGEYVFTVGNVGPNQETQNGTVRITTFPGLPVSEARDITAGPFPFTALMALTRSTSPPDPARVFRIAPSSDLTFTAVAEWSGPALLALVWDDCESRFPRGRQPRTVRDSVRQGAGMPSGDGTEQFLGTPLTAISSTIGTSSVARISSGRNERVRVKQAGFSADAPTGREGAARAALPLRIQIPRRSTIIGGPSGVRAEQTIPAGACRLLIALRTDTTTAAAIIRLRVTSP